MNDYRSIIEKIATDKAFGKQAGDIVNECFEKIAYLGANNDGSLDYELSYDSTPDHILKTIEEGDEYWENPRTQLRFESIGRDINDMVNNHEHKQKAIDEINFNQSRNRIKHKHSGKVGLGVFGAGAAAPLVLSKKLNKPLIKTLTPHAALISGVAGMTAAHKMNEKVRNKHHGAKKEEYINMIYDDVDKYFSNQDAINKAINNADNEYRALKSSADKYSRMSGGHYE